VVKSSSRPQIWFLYVVECNDLTLYTGITTDVERRLIQHNSGRGASYTAARSPVRLVAAWRFFGRGAALRAERSFKALSRRRKLYLVENKLSYESAPVVY
jgi:putative endonuclease